jgi:hypothetical protein
MANPNMKALRAAVRELGGKTIGSKTGAKHYLVSIETPDGKIIRVALSKSPMRDGHVRFWIRQKFQRAKQKGKVK